MNFSVVICTHNPRAAYLKRVLEALRRQTLPKKYWELLLIDNASKESLASQWDLSWHPQAHHIREDELGLTPARLRGINESAGTLIVFVDDDNVLSEDYLETAWHLHLANPFLAAWGGSISPEYEEQPGDWFKLYEVMLAIRTVTEDRWGNNPYDSLITPIGAGLVITKDLGLRYIENINANPLRSLLDRKGDQLTGHGDIDIAMTACTYAKGMGVFSALKLTHLIPSSRIQLPYLLKLAEGNGFSIHVHRHTRGELHTPAPMSGWQRVYDYRRIIDLIRLCKMPSFEREMLLAARRGQAKAIVWLQARTTSPNP